MNNERRNALLDVCSSIDDIIDDIETIADEEQDALDSMPESLQSSFRAETMSNYIDIMGLVINDLEKANQRINIIILKKNEKKQ